MMRTHVMKEENPTCRKKSKKKRRMFGCFSLARLKAWCIMLNIAKIYLSYEKLCRLFHRIKAGKITSAGWAFLGAGDSLFLVKSIAYVRGHTEN